MRTSAFIAATFAAISSLEAQIGRWDFDFAAADGSLWLVFGTDSGFEGRSELYYSRLTVWVDTAQQPLLWLEPGTSTSSYTLVWNMTGQLETADNLGGGWLPVSATNRPHMYNGNEPRRFWRIGPLPPTKPR